MDSPIQDSKIPKTEQGQFGFDDERDEPSEVTKATGKRKADEKNDEDESEEEEESEDDLAVAFAVLDLSRVIFERILDASESRPASSKDAANKTTQKAHLKTLTGETLDELALVLELGEVYNDLGDVGLESGMCICVTQKTLSKLLMIMPLHCAYSRPC